MYQTKNDELVNEAVRQLTICNACRYCEGFCDVWDSIETRRNFSKGDVFHLANLCHDCRQCYYACPYTPPHEFGINIPKILGEIRQFTYKEFAFPNFMRRIIDKSPLLYAILTMLFFFVGLSYVIFNHGLNSLFSIRLGISKVFPSYYFFSIEYSLYAYLLILWSIQGYYYWKTISNGKKIDLNAVFKAVYDTLSHKNFKGGGAGCNYPSEEANYYRLSFHALVMYGFLLDWITILFYPFKNYLLLSLYFIGSLMMTAGSATTLFLNVITHSAPESENTSKFGNSLLALLLISGITGIGFILLFSQPEWVIFFLLRDSTIITIFLTAPYSKFVHPIYRFLSLVLNRKERVGQN